MGKRSSMDLQEMAYDTEHEEKAKSSCCCLCTTTRSFILLIIFGTLAIVSGAVFMPMVYDAMMSAIVNDMMVLTPDSLLYPEWANPSIPLKANFFFFEILNPDEIYNGAKPEVAEKGPYVYNLYVRKDNVTVNGNGTISSIPIYTYVFDRESSVGPETDRFLGVNMPMTSTAYMMRNAPRFVRESMSKILESLNETMFIELSVGELLWGYDEPLFELVNEIFPIEGVTDQFGFLLGYNGTDISGVFTVFDGVDDKSILNRVDKWKGQSQLDFWATPEANMMNGTDGMMWSPFIEDVKVLQLFHQDFCRTIPYVYSKDQMFKGIPLKRFHLAPYAYDNGTTHPPNAGFCEGDTCAPSGIQRMDACRFGSPMGMSNPHFLESDPSFIEEIVGLRPDEERHRNYFLLEPIMGMPYVMRQRLQISMYLEQVQGIKQMGNVRTMYLPSLWFSQEVDVPDSVIDTYKLGFQTTDIMMSIIGYIMIVIGSLMVIPAAIVLIFKFIRRNSNEKDIEDFQTSYKQKEPVAYTNHVYQNTFDALEKDTDISKKDERQSA